MSFLTKNHNQDITYWSTPSPDGFGGNTYAAPVTIKGRWEDSQKKFISSTGEESVSKAVLYMGQDMQIGGWAFLGTSVVTTPETVANAHEIRGFNKTPNLKGTSWEREVII